ncbi:WhiB family transcriptional regulator [Paeniglutamicibacter sp. MACA_103]|uniref:WhiB family transcriptional regulator n=1 Tax=Paeniglutamicibacter sp. MACA_103 TaxID=3377337 RepID=UPI003894E491
MKWVHGAACAGDPSPGDWFASADADRTARAVAVCGGCPVRLECLEVGLGEGRGVWGGVPRDGGQVPGGDREQDQAILEARKVARSVARREQERKRLALESPEAREMRLAVRREYSRKRRARATEAG